jgi:hypothetical protein
MQLSSGGEKHIPKLHKYNHEKFEDETVHGCYKQADFFLIKLRAVMTICFLYT